MRIPLEATGGYSGLDELVAIAALVLVVVLAAAIALVVYVVRRVKANRALRRG